MLERILQAQWCFGQESILVLLTSDPSWAVGPQLPNITLVRINKRLFCILREENNSPFLCFSFILTENCDFFITNTSLLCPSECWWNVQTCSLGSSDSICLLTMPSNFIISWRDRHIDVFNSWVINKIFISEHTGLRCSIAFDVLWFEYAGRRSTIGISVNHLYLQLMNVWHRLVFGPW